MIRTRSLYKLFFAFALFFTSLWVFVLFFKYDTIENYSISTFHIDSKQQEKHDQRFIECIILNKYSSKCMSISESIYLPLDSIIKTFDLRSNKRANETLEIQFTNAKIYQASLNESYNSSGKFLWFENYNVESRERVKHMSLKYGVPVSSQWLKKGHLYPVQIAQFGLSHFSKYVSEKDAVFDQDKICKLIISDESTFVSNNPANLTVLTGGFEFDFAEKTVFQTKYFACDMRYFQADLRTQTFIQFMLEIIVRESIYSSGKHVVRLKYELNNHKTCSESFSYLFKNTIHMLKFKLNAKLNESFRFIRNICLDVCKSLPLKKCDYCFMKNSDASSQLNATAIPNFYFFKVYQFSVKGSGQISNAVFSSKPPHLEFAKKAAEYFLDHQHSETGGWRINVTRKFDSLSTFRLEPGWHSAMSQGHAISLLCRLYSHAKLEKYLQSAEKAFSLYEISAEKNGIRAEWSFNNKSIIWFEEYPTRPHHLFVLNGFIYSLIGLSDFLTSDCGSSSSIRPNVEKAFFDALKSLKMMINFYDTGARSLYDLRHLTNARLNPNVARWDYHTLHVSQLFYLSTILANLRANSKYDAAAAKLLLECEQLFYLIARRWSGYKNGVWHQNSQLKI